MMIMHIMEISKVKARVMVYQCISHHSAQYCTSVSKGIDDFRCERGYNYAASNLKKKAYLLFDHRSCKTCRRAILLGTITCNF